MIQSDNHVHTGFSSDSSTPMEDMIARGKTLGLSSICFTDHIDYGFPAETYQMEFLFSVEDYFQKICELSEKITDFSLRTGVELGLKKDILAPVNTLTGSHAFDFVIGSTHLVDNIDPYYEEYWDSFGESQGIRRYYEATLENIRLGFDFDVYGHIDYVIRYCPSVKKTQETPGHIEKYYQQMLTENSELLDEILSSLIAAGKGIEVNTGGLVYGLGHPNPHEDILRRYHALGGEILTIGSDAHTVQSLAFGFSGIVPLLQSCGFTRYTEFHKRKPIFLSL